MNNSKIKILAVDDEHDVLEIIEYNLKTEGYQVFLAQNGEEALKKAIEIKPDLIILDIMMPKLDGMETCKRLRKMEQFKDTLIVFLTARAEEFLEVAGFGAGADDYITKPIKPRALVSRLSTLLRRNTETQENIVTQSGRIEIENLVIDRESYLVYQNGVALSFARKEFELLSMLASKPGKVFGRDEILDKIWGDDVVVVIRTIDVHIRKIREKLGDDYLTTVKGVGYKFRKN
jgi:two-component system alkaline phosphatase synthesis response regulator PhoP